MDGIKLSPERVFELLGELCVELGFCLPPEEQDRLAKNPPVSIDAFADSVFVGDGMDPRHSPNKLRTQVHCRVAKYFEICALLDDEVDHIGDESQRSTLLALLTVPRRIEFTWEYGKQDRLTCWQIGQSTDRGVWLVYCEVGFGPAFPWGFVFPETKSLGSDDQWHSGLVDAAICAGLLVAPDGYESPGPRS